MASASEQRSISEQIVDAMNALHGSHPGHRAAHAKGTFAKGRFTGAPAAGKLSRAPHLQGDEVEVLARFSNGSGNPRAKDGDRRDGRGLAVKFRLPDGEDTDIVAVTLPVFFVRTADDFLGFLRAREPDPETGDMDMEKVGAFLGEHPETGAAVQLILPSLTPPPSFANARYNGLHAFGFLNGNAGARYGRYSWIPGDGEAQLSDEEIEATSPDYLQEEIRKRLGSGSASFTLQVQLAGDGDVLDDPTVAWPEEREVVELGRLELTDVVEDAEGPGAPVVFDPTNLIDGIECSEDQILAARSPAYSVSVERRIASAS